MTTLASRRAGSLTVLLFALAAPIAAQTVFTTDFENGIPAAFSAPGCQLDGVQGYAGLGPIGRRFGGNFLHYTTTQVVPTTLTLTNLPPHTAVDLEFLLALIDSWDGIELMEIRVDGALLFSHWFQLATGDATDYVAPSGALLSSGTSLGFTQGSYYDRDRAYDLAVEPAFRAIPHTASTLTIEWSLSAISGGAAQNWQGGADESWGLDAVRVTVWENGGRSYGTGCGLPPLRIAPDASSQPTPGGILVTNVFDITAGRGAVMSVGLSDAVWNGLPLPLDLGPFGVTGCTLYQDLAVFGVPCTPVSLGNATFAIAVPTSTTLGLRLFEQAFAPSPGTNPLGLATSNGLEFAIR